MFHLISHWDTSVMQGHECNAKSSQYTHPMILVGWLVVVGLNTIFQHMIGYTWWPVLMIKEETGNPQKEPPTQEKLLASFLTNSHSPNLRLEHRHRRDGSAHK
ncbi:hypothetical protein CHS0354_015604 [Potamilus streckersoni]|uniref:Uncharacterized protein n=1 Tax=Potamilus streckersoni TaxID=2493646 RepID=A0AAE0TCN0_9BIVA|nr:hypothetical protein CHS0354_015604 [Potamilus streckersoni]